MQELESLCRHLDQQAIVALDTEFIRKKTYYPQPCLMQLADRENIFLIDVLNIPDCRSICHVLAGQQKIKVMHDCGQDIEVFAQLCDEKIEAIFDTQLAAAFLACGYQIAYKKLVQKRLGVQLENEQTRSDWTQRPLSSQQKDYAAADVFYLLPLWESLEAELKRTGKHSWFMKESLRRAEAKKQNHSDHGEQAQSFLQKARQWREREAQKINRPRQWLVSDTSLAIINARSLDRKQDILQLGEKHFMNPRYASILAQLMSRHKADRATMPVTEKKEWSMSRKEKNCMQKINDLVEDLAKRHEIEVKLLAKRRDITNCIRKHDCSEWLQGWRRQLLSSSDLKQIDHYLKEL